MRHIGGVRRRLLSCIWRRVADAFVEGGLRIFVAAGRGGKNSFFILNAGAVDKSSECVHQMNFYTIR